MGGAPEPDRALRGEADPLKETTNPTGASSGDGDVFRSPVEALESLEGPEGQVRNRPAVLGLVDFLLVKLIDFIF
jgi:hypothetical protein